MCECLTHCGLVVILDLVIICSGNCLLYSQDRSTSCITKIIDGMLKSTSEINSKSALKIFGTSLKKKLVSSIFLFGPSIFMAHYFPTRFSLITCLRAHWNPRWPKCKANCKFVQLVAWWRQAITWINANLLSMGPSGMHLYEISMIIYRSLVIVTKTPFETNFKPWEYFQATMS